MNAVQNISVAQEDDGIRIDRWFQRHFPDIGFGALNKMMRKGEVRLDGKRVKGNERVAAGQTVRVPPYQAAAADEKPAKPQGLRLSDDEIREIQSWVIYKDSDVIVINKPAGLPTQGGTGVTRHLDGMLDALMFEKESRPKLVHRLDKDTSGALLLARSTSVAASLAEAFASRVTDKRYWALVVGTPRQYQGRIKLMMDKGPGRAGAGERMIVTPDGKRSVTDYQVVDKAAGRASWLTLKPLTGRTHQLRLHCSEMGHPIVGDGKYGGTEAYLSGAISRKLHLHSYMIRFPHPKGGMVEVTAPLPPHMDESFRMLGFDPATYEDPEFED